MNLLGKCVKVHFKNGESVDGVLDDLTDKYIVLSSAVSDNNLLIFDPLNNVLMIQTISEEVVKEIKDSSNLKTEIEVNDEEIFFNEKNIDRKVTTQSEILKIEESQDEDEKFVADMSLRAKSIAELKALEAKAEAEQIAFNLKKQIALEKQQELLNNSEGKYGTPDFTKYRPQKPASEESFRYAGADPTKVREMFQRKANKAK